jgi:GNAT superfamily N-acetyltransferase
LVQYSKAHWRPVLDLLDFLPSLYPNGDRWLENRLTEVLARQATCTLAIAGCRPVGIAIETPKGSSRLKLSTFYIHPSFRGLGTGRRLLASCMSRWIHRGVSEAYVTADSSYYESLHPFFASFSFRIESVVHNRYAVGRNELVFIWHRR